MHTWRCDVTGNIISWGVAKGVLSHRLLALHWLHSSGCLSRSRARHLAVCVSLRSALKHTSECIADRKYIASEGTAQRKITSICLHSCLMSHLAAGHRSSTHSVCESDFRVGCSAGCFWLRLGPFAALAGRTILCRTPAAARGRALSLLALRPVACKAWCSALRLPSILRKQSRCASREGLVLKMCAWHSMCRRLKHRPPR